MAKRRSLCLFVSMLTAAAWLSVLNRHIAAQLTVSTSR